MNVQFIEEDGVRKFAVLPVEDYEQLLEAAEDLAAIAAYDAAREQETVPVAFVDRMLAGESLVRLWREHRGTGQENLAAAAGISKAYLSQIENGRRRPTVETLRRLADALSISVDDLL